MLHPSRTIACEGIHEECYGVDQFLWHIIIVRRPTTPLPHGKEGGRAHRGPLHKHIHNGLRNSCWAESSVFLMVIHDCIKCLV